MSENPDKTAAFDIEAVFQVDDYMYFYSDFLTDEVSERQVAALVQMLDLKPPMKILDLACGFGRHANRLAVLGYDVTGIDMTPGFLELARQDAQLRGVSVEYRLGDMRMLDEEETYDRVLLIFTAFGYFEDEENMLVLKKITRALKNGGLLIFDVPNRDTFMKEFLPYIVTEKEGNLMIDRITFDILTGRQHNRRIVIRDGVRRDKPFSVRMYNSSEVRSLLDQAGLRLEALYGGWDSQPVSTESRRMVIIARK